MPVPYGNMLHTSEQISPRSCQTGAIPKSLSLNEKRIFREKVRRMGQ